MVFKHISKKGKKYMNITEKEFINIIVEDLFLTATKIQPEKLAFVIYGRFKEHPEIIKSSGMWSSCLTNIRIILENEYKWHIRSIYRFIIKLDDLAKYMKK
jgi:hypothetical protein